MLQKSSRFAEECLSPLQNRAKFKNLVTDFLNTLTSLTTCKRRTRSQWSRRDGSPHPAQRNITKLSIRFGFILEVFFTPGNICPFLLWLFVEELVISKKGKAGHCSQHFLQLCQVIRGKLCDGRNYQGFTAYRYYIWLIWTKKHQRQKRYHIWPMKSFSGRTTVMRMGTATSHTAISGTSTCPFLLLSQKPSLFPKAAPLHPSPFHRTWSHIKNKEQDLPKLYSKSAALISHGKQCYLIEINKIW